MWVMGIEFRSSARTVYIYAYSNWMITSDPLFMFLIKGTFVFLIYSAILAIFWSSQSQQMWNKL